MRGSVVARLAVALVLVQPTAVAAPPTGADGLTLEGCLLSGVNFEDRGRSLVEEGWVPDGYALRAPATVLIWTFSCAAVHEGSNDWDDVRFSVVGVALQAASVVEGEDGVVVPDWPGSWGIYVVAINGDDPALVRWLRDHGMPARHRAVDLRESQVEPLPEVSADVPDTLGELPETCTSVGGVAPGTAHAAPDPVQEPEPNKTTLVTVGAPGDVYRTMTSPLGHHNAVTHCHDQLLRHGAPEGGSALRLTIPAARDHFCRHPMPDCASATARAASDVGHLLGHGGHRGDPRLAFDHEPIAVLRLTPA